MKTFARSLVAFTLILCSQAVFAIHEGIFVTGTVGPSLYFLHGEVIADKVALNTSFGFQLLEYAGIELGYVLHNQTGDNLQAVYGDVKFILPTNELLDIFAKAGVGRLEQHGLHRYDAFVATGLDFYVIPTIALTLQLQSFFNKHNGIGLVGLGVTYRPF